MPEFLRRFSRQPDLERAFANWKLRGSSTAIAFTVLVLGLAFLAVTLARQPITSMDFRYIWTAGEMWGHRQNPYSPDFVTLGRSRFPDGVPMGAWLYPPQWYGIARLANLLAPAPAYALWVIGTSVGLGACWLLLWKAARSAGVPWTKFDFLASSAYACTTTIVSLGLREGQPAVVAQCGIALIVYGLLREHRLVAAVGASLALLKPTLALPFLVAICFTPGGLRIIALAAVLTAFAALPAALATSVPAQVSGWLAQSGDYQAIAHNTASDMTGAPHAILVSGAGEVPVILSVILAVLIAAMLGLLWRLRAPTQRKLAQLLVGCMLVTASVEGLHNYDLVILLFTLPFMPSLTGLPKLLAITGFVVMWRPENISRLLASTDKHAATIVTVGIFLVVAGWVLSSWRKRSQPRPYSSSSRTMSSSLR
jgi:hypothetical protein